MHCIKLFRLMLGNLQHLHGKYAEAVLLKLLDDIADAIFANRIGFHDGKGAFESLHSVLVLRHWSFVFSLEADYAKQVLSPLNLLLDRREKGRPPKGAMAEAGTHSSPCSWGQRTRPRFLLPRRTSGVHSQRRRERLTNCRRRL